MCLPPIRCCPSFSGLPTGSRYSATRIKHNGVSKDVLTISRRRTQLWKVDRKITGQLIARAQPPASRYVENMLACGRSYLVQNKNSWQQTNPNSLKPSAKQLCWLCQVFWDISMSRHINRQTSPIACITSADASCGFAPVLSRRYMVQDDWLRNKWG